MSKQNIFDFLEDANENEIETLERMTPEFSEEQFERILKMSVAKKESIRKEKEKKQDTDSVEVSEVRVHKFSIWKRFLSVAVLFLLISGSFLTVGHFAKKINLSSAKPKPFDVPVTSVTDETETTAKTVTLATEASTVTTDVADNDISNTKEPNTETLINEYFESVISISSFNENIYVSGNMISEKTYEFTCPENNKRIVFSAESDQIYFFDDKLCTVYQSSENYYGVQLIDRNNGETRYFPLEQTDISDLMFLNDDIFYISEQNNLCVVDMVTNEKSEYALPAEFKKFSEKCFTVDENGYIYFFCSDTSDNKVLYKFDNELNEIFYMKNLENMKGEVKSALSHNKGRIILSSGDSDITVIEAENGDIYREYKLSNVDRVFVNSSKYDIVYSSTENDVYGYGFRFNNYPEEIEPPRYSYDKGEKVFGITSEEMPFVCDNKYNSGILVLDKESNLVNEIPFVTERNGYVWKSRVNKSGDIYYIEENFSWEFYERWYWDRDRRDPDVPNTYIVHCITADGSHSSFEVPVHENALVAKSMEVDTNGNVLIMEIMNDIQIGDPGQFNGSLYLSSYDKNGNLNGTYELKDCRRFYESFPGGDGDTIFVKYQSQGVFGNNFTFIKIKQSAEGIDIDIEYQYEKENTSDVLYNVGTCMTGNDEYDMFVNYYSDTLIYGIDLENNQKTEILDLSDFSDMSHYRIYYAGDKFFLDSLWESGNGVFDARAKSWRSVSIN